MKRSLLIAYSLAASAYTIASGWIDATRETGLGGHQVSRLKFADLNGDALPDAILLPDHQAEAEPLVFINRLQASSDRRQAPNFEEIENHGLPKLQKGDVLVFSDLNNDGKSDAILGRYLDIYQDNYQAPSSAPLRSSWFPGKGDGTFEAPLTLSEATIGTTRAIAINDINRDGLPDLFLGNWYQRYFTGYEAFANDVLIQYPGSDDEPKFVRWPIPFETSPTDYTNDTGGRPTYGAGIVVLDEGLPYLAELNYGRRWNRLYQLSTPARLLKPDSSQEDWETDPFETPNEPQAIAQHLVRQLRGQDIAPSAHFDGDSIRHGRHPTWPEELTRSRPRAKRPDEPPFRANGNTFDLAVGDIDNDGDFDVFLSTIIHAWAGESSDRSRFLVNQLQETGKLNFLSFERLSVDRLPDPPAPGEALEARHTTEQNQGDIYAELADLNNDGRLDLILCSSDYADEPPHDERVRLFYQQEDGRFKDLTHELGIDHIGAGMPALADVDTDGDLDLLVGQSFNRFNAELRRKAGLANGSLSNDSPQDAKPERRARLFLNNSAEGRASVSIRLTGDPKQSVSKEAYGAVILLTADLDAEKATPPTTQRRQIHGPAGHAGKQSSFTIHFGLGNASQADRIEIRWPNGTASVFENTKPGRYQLKLGDSQLSPL